jgi:predicted nucleotidyltransferase
VKTLAYIPLKANDRKAIEAAKDLLVQKYPVELIILYGSEARGTDDAESDIDLLVLTTRELTWRERNAITDTLCDIQLAHGVVISTLVVANHEWLEGRYSVLPIHDEIERYGVATC